MDMRSRIVQGWAALALALAGPGRADDTDIFLTPPGAGSTAAPNVLIVLDNSANWSANFDGGTKFTSEIATLASVIGALDDKVNVGLMMMDETGAGTTAPTSGSYVRFAVRNMNASNRTALRNLVSALGQNPDKTNNASWGFAMFEAFKYFGGGTGSPQSPTHFGREAYSGFGQPKRDYPGNGVANTAGAVPGNAFASAATRTYQSPIADSCQKNYVIFIGNGMPQAGGDGGNPSAATLLANVGGNTSTIPLSSTTARNNIADEYARFLYQTDLGSPAGTQNVITYTVAVYDPAHMTGSDPDMIMLMTSMAAQGGGRYFAATNTVSLRNALETILTEVQAVNSVFASSTLPVSVNVRGTYLNQVYMGVFRPDADAAPRWLGNLKEYRLAVSSTEQLYLADANGNAVENSSTGFVTPTAVSYWTAPSSFWSFAPAGAGGISDSPDGDIVEKGGAAQVLRTTFPTSQAARKVYTCAACASEDITLKPFDTGNAAITAAALGAADSAERARIIDFVRGQELTDENVNGTIGDVRASIHGDVLHSRPAVVNYNRTGDDNDIVVFYGGNDGMLHATKGGQGAGGGVELWAFVAPEFYGKLKRLADNSPKISTTAPRPYFFDGMLSAWHYDAGGDGVLDAADGDKVYLYVSARRGGRLLYAFDVSDPEKPRVMWKRGCPNATNNTGCSSGYAELGQTWSMPQAVKVKASNDPMLLMGAGYDAAANDAMPQGTAGMGRGIMAIDGLTGIVRWQAGPAPSGASINHTVSGMSYSIASDLALLDRDFEGNVDRVYAPDTGGNIWRVDTDDANPAMWAVTKVAALGGSGAAARKFLYPPDVVYVNGTSPYDAILIGSGDREHPFDTTIDNRFYMIKDTNVDTTGTDLNITEGQLYNATANLVQDGTDAERAAAKTALNAARGWYISLASGEKVVGNSITLAGTTFFGTNQPTPAAPGVCTPNLGEARLYSVSYADGSAAMENNGSAGLTLTDRYRVRAGGGYPPSFVPISVQLNGKVYQGVISGTQVITAPVQAGKRKRTFWFREMDK
jgi:type IV pilus assembly protein PilY1